jgi:tetratricopeptide (TPR) repeat protein
MAIASCYWQMSDFINDNKNYLAVLKKEPNNLEALANSAYAYYSINDFNNAKLTANKIIALDKQNKSANELLQSIEENEYSTQLQEAVLKYEQKQFNQSLAILDKYITKKPNDEYALYYKGLNLEEMQKPNEAIKQYKLLISKISNFAPAYYSLAILLDNGEKYEEAVQNYEKFVSLKGNEKDEMVNFSQSRIKELTDYLSEVNANK